MTCPDCDKLNLFIRASEPRITVATICQTEISIWVRCSECDRKVRRVQHSWRIMPETSLVVAGYYG